MKRLTVIILSCFIIIYAIFQGTSSSVCQHSRLSGFECSTVSAWQGDNDIEEKAKSAEKRAGKATDQRTVRSESRLLKYEHSKVQPRKVHHQEVNEISVVGCEKWDGLIDQYSQSESEEVWAKRVMRCESRCNPNAVNQSSGASGLFQIIQKWHPSMVGRVFDGEESIKYALLKYRQGGAGLWVCK